MDNQSTTPPSPQPQQPQSATPAPVPYTPQTLTEPPVQQQSKQTGSPVITVGVLSVIILLVGFMAYNAIGSQLTKLAGQSTNPSSYSQIITPTPTSTVPTTAVVTPTPVVTSPSVVTPSPVVTSSPTVSHSHKLTPTP